MTKHPYSYAVLQYHHDAWVGEALNVGVLLYSEHHRYLRLHTRTAQGRLAKAYPGIDHEAFRGMMGSLERGFERLANRSGLFMPSGGALQIGKSLLRADDSSLQWGFSGVGLSDDPERAHERQFDRFVKRYDAEPGREIITDDMVFETVRKKLERAEILHLMRPHTVESQFASVTFDHSVRNGVWHCIQPLSFDSADEDRMLAKAAKWVGIMQSISSCSSEIRAYIVTGAPKIESLLPQYARMVDFLRTSPLQPLVVDEQDSGKIVNAVVEAVAH